MSEDQKQEAIPSHMFTARKYRLEEYKKLCDGQWAKAEMYHKDNYTCNGKKPKGFVTIRSSVTCKDCLKILIPKVEAELEKMRKNYAAGES